MLQQDVGLEGTMFGWSLSYSACISLRFDLRKTEVPRMNGATQKNVIDKQVKCVKSKLPNASHLHSHENVAGIRLSGTPRVCSFLGSLASWFCAAHHLRSRIRVLKTALLVDDIGTIFLNLVVLHHERKGNGKVPLTRPRKRHPAEFSPRR
jgi:hypothetical protein